jgi:DNA-binding response OmpR family regulator
MKQIWIVDDDEEMSLAVELMLTLLNFTSRIFLDARAAAKELLSGDHPDLIILDINMPVVSGLDLLEFIRRRKEFEKIPVVMLSTEAAEVLVDKTLWMGADAYVTKPVAVEELDEAIQKAFLAHGVTP